MFKKNNIIDNRKFDEFVRESLGDYEVDSVSPDWQKMQNMLSISSKAQPLQSASSDFFSLSVLKNRTVSYGILAVIMLAVAGYLIYALVKPSGNTENAVVETTDSLQNISEITAAPVVDSVKKEPAIVSFPIDTVVSKTEAKKEDVAETKEKKEVKKEPETANTPDKKKEPKKEEIKKVDTKERDKKVETEGAVKKKEEQLKKSDNAIGLSNLLLLPVDNQEQQAPKQSTDSTKAP